MSQVREIFSHSASQNQIESHRPKIRHRPQKEKAGRTHSRSLWRLPNKDVRQLGSDRQFDRMPGLLHPELSQAATEGSKKERSADGRRNELRHRARSAPSRSLANEHKHS